MGILDALRRPNTGSTDAMRQTTTLTMAYLLEQNRQFEAYMREKVEELEARVAAQQARASVKIEAADETTRPTPPVIIADRTQPVVSLNEADDDLLSLFSADFELDEVGEVDIVPPLETVTASEAEITDEAEAAGAVLQPAWTDWEAALLGPAAAESLPVQDAGLVPTTDELTPSDEAEKAPGADEPDEVGDSLLPVWLQAQTTQAEMEADEVETASGVVIDEVAAEQEAEEAEVSPPQTLGPVEDWA